MFLNCETLGKWFWSSLAMNYSCLTTNDFCLTKVTVTLLYERWKIRGIQIGIQIFCTALLPSVTSVREKEKKCQPSKQDTPFNNIIIIIIANYDTIKLDYALFQRSNSNIIERN